MYCHSSMAQYGWHTESNHLMSAYIVIPEYLQYKYQINLDGTVAAYRFPYLLGGDSLVLKQDSNYYEHFYKSLKPYEHYVPFKRDLSDLKEKLEWARKHDKEVRVLNISN